MLYRNFGKTGEKVSALGFGCMRFQVEDNKQEKIIEDLAVEQLRYAIDNGVNYIDTAYPYHSGMSEILVGKALKDGYREKVYLATKSPSWLIKNREDLDKYLDEQLKKLDTDHIDFYLLHALKKEYWDNYLENDVFDFIKKAKESGKIKYIGFSFHDEYKVFEEIINSYEWDFCQIQYNFMDQDYQAGEKGLKLAASKNIGVVIMEPLRGGSLTGNVPEDIKEIWDKSTVKRTPAEWALKFLWNHPEISVVLSGMNMWEHIKENIKTASETLPESLTEYEKNLIEEVRKAYTKKIKVNCTACQYCMPCPAGVNIPLNFSVYNNYGVYGNKERIINQYKEMTLGKKSAEFCIECGKCESVCPQHIEIRSKLKEIVNLVKG